MGVVSVAVRFVKLVSFKLKKEEFDRIPGCSGTVTGACEAAAGVYTGKAVT